MLTRDELTDREGGELCDLVDWWDCFHPYPGVMFTKKGRFLATYALAYRDTEQMSAEERAWYLSQIDEAQRLLPEGWAVESDLWHEPTAHYPTVEWEALDGVSVVDHLVDAIRHQAFVERPRHASQLYVTLSWDPPSRHRQWLREIVLLKAEVQRHRHNLEEDLALFLEGADLYMRGLRPALDACAPLTADQLCTYLHQLVSWDREPLACPLEPTDLDWQLTSELFLPGQPLLLGDHYVQALTIKTWLSSLRTFVPEALSKCPFPLRYHVRWVPKSLTTAEALLTAAERKWAALYKGLKGIGHAATGHVDDSEVEGRSTQDLAIQAGASIVAMRRDVRQGRRVTGQLKPTVVLWAPDLETLDARVKEVHEVLLHQGLVVRQEKPGNSIEWLASLAGHRDYGIRHRLLGTEELTATTVHHAQWPGVQEEPCLGGPPWLQATSDGAPFGVAMHDGDLASAMIMGPTRSGKSGLLGLLISQGFKYPGMRTCVFDLDESLLCLTLMRGGAHYALGDPSSPPIQILGPLDTEEEQNWAALQLELMLTGEGLPPTPKERREILHTVRAMGDPEVPMALRTLSLARILLQSDRLKVGLAPFCAGGEYAFCDGAQDDFAWAKRLICFEMNALKTKPRALGPVLSWCFHQLERRWFTGSPVRIVIDEARWLLGIQAMFGQMEEWLKTRAKLRVGLWMSTQEMADLHTTGIWQAAVASMPVRLLLPNLAAMSEKVQPLYEQLGLPPHIIRRLTLARRYEDYLYSSPQGHRVFQCAMSPVERLLCAASRPEERALLHAYRSEYSPEELPIRWLDHFGYAEEASILAAHLERKEQLCAVNSLVSVPLPWERPSSSLVSTPS